MRLWPMTRRHGLRSASVIPEGHGREPDHQIGRSGGIVLPTKNNPSFSPEDKKRRLECRSLSRSAPGHHTLEEPQLRELLVSVTILGRRRQIKLLPWASGSG